MNKILPLITAVAAGFLAPVTARADVITDWNRTADDYGSQQSGYQWSRVMAMVHVAQFDAVNAVVGGYTPYALDVSAPGASPIAAAAQAAYTVLTNISRANVATLNSALSRSLAAVPDGPAEDDGRALGRLAANTIIRLRAADKWDLAIKAVTNNLPGKWRATPPNYTAGVGAEYRYFLPWTMRSPAQFRPGPPPALNSELYATDLEEVRLLGASRTTNRTPSQTQAANFHHPGAQAIIRPAVAHEALPLIESARAHALFYMVSGDAEIAFLETQHFYSFWRPITALRDADNDGNDATVSYPTWTPLLETPNHPEYPSGTCATESAGVSVLISIYGDDFPFTATAANGTRRSFERLSAMVEDAITGRICAGAHYRNSCRTGIELGRQIAEHALKNVLRPLQGLIVDRHANGGFQLMLGADQPLRYIVQTSTDLSQWLPVQTNIFGITWQSDPNAAPAERRFYRAVMQP